MAGRPLFHITVNSPRGIALVKGRDVKRACQLIGVDPGWSKGGHGWVIPAASAPDLVALAQADGEYVVIRELFPETDESQAS